MVIRTLSVLCSVALYKDAKLCVFRQRNGNVCSCRIQSPAIFFFTPLLISALIKVQPCSKCYVNCFHSLTAISRPTIWKS
jgi:hypothetical protein